MEKITINKIDEKLIRLLKSDISIDQIKYLVNSSVLNLDEEKLCVSMINNTSIAGFAFLERTLISNDYPKDKFDSIDIVRKNEINIEIEEYIRKLRVIQNESILTKLLDESVSDVYGAEAMNLLRKRYAVSLVDEKEDMFDSLRNFTNNDLESSSIEISSTNEYIDRLTDGICPKCVTTIVSNDKFYNKIFAINIAYGAMVKEKNILYLTASNSKREIYLNFLTRHSCLEEKFDKPISYIEFKVKFDENAYQSIYNDFANNLNDRLIIRDSVDIKVLNPYSLQRIFCLSDEKFKKSTNKGIDLIVVDGLEDLRLELGKKTIVNRNSVETEYYKFFNDLALSESIPVIITNLSNLKDDYLLENGSDFSLNYLSEPTKQFSSTILSVYGNTSLRKNNKLKIKVLKSKKDIMKESIDIFCNHDTLLIKDNDAEDMKQIITPEFADYLVKENEIITQENMDLEKKNYELQIQIQNQNNTMDFSDMDDLFNQL